MWNNTVDIILLLCYQNDIVDGFVKHLVQRESKENSNSDLSIE